jgi:hypothetical protein
LAATRPVGSILSASYGISGTKVGQILNALAQSLVLFLAVVAAVGLGIVSAYAAVTGILYYTLGNQSEERSLPAVLVETHASGD